MPSASIGGIALAATNKTSHTIDLCKVMDTALSKAIGLPGCASVGYVVELELSAVTVVVHGTAASISCKIAVDVVAPASRAGAARGGARVDGSSQPRDVAAGVNDCVSAVIEDLFMKNVFP